MRECFVLSEICKKSRRPTAVKAVNHTSVLKYVCSPSEYVQTLGLQKQDGGFNPFAGDGIQMWRFADEIGRGAGPVVTLEASAKDAPKVRRARSSDPHFSAFNARRQFWSPFPSTLNMFETAKRR